MIELAFCSFGEQWEYTIVHNHLHHPHLNDNEKDSECPDEGHVAVQVGVPSKERKDTGADGWEGGRGG